MDSINISLPQPMADFVRAAVERDYGNVSEYFRELVRERQQKEVAADLALLQATHAEGPVGPTEEEILEILKVQKKVRRELRARRA